VCLPWQGSRPQIRSAAENLPPSPPAQEVPMRLFFLLAVVVFVVGDFGAILEPSGWGPILEPSGWGPILEPSGWGPILEPSGGG
jgi:hypothetical protein